MKTHERSMHLLQGRFRSHCFLVRRSAHCMQGGTSSRCCCQLSTRWQKLDTGTNALRHNDSVLAVALLGPSRLIERSGEEKDRASATRNRRKIVQLRGKKVIARVRATLYSCVETRRSENRAPAPREQRKKCPCEQHFDAPIVPLTQWRGKSIANDRL